jgi:hypothetical protein
MIATSPAPIRLVSFGAANGEQWGLVLDAGEPAVLLVTKQGARSAAGAAAVRIAEDAGRWSVSGDGFALTVDGAPEADRPASQAGDELCRVTGTVGTNGSQLAIDLEGIRTRDADPDSNSVESLRCLAGWFGDSRGLIVRSLRSPRSKGHGQDRLAATVFDPDDWLTAADPRISTTYREGERPTRASLELWIGEGEEQYPRRATIEAVAEPLAVEGEHLRVSVTPVRCHSGGLDGAGLFLIAHL